MYWQLSTGGSAGGGEASLAEVPIKTNAGETAKLIGPHGVSVVGVAGTFVIDDSLILLDVPGILTVTPATVALVFVVLAAWSVTRGWRGGLDNLLGCAKDSLKPWSSLLSSGLIWLGVTLLIRCGCDEIVVVIRFVM